MADDIRPFDYYSAVTRHDASQTAAVLRRLSESGINLLAFAEFSPNTGGAHLDLIVDDPEVLKKAAQGMGLPLSERRSGILIRGENRPGAVAEVLGRLADAHIAVAAVQSISAGAGRFGAFLRVNPADLSRAVEVASSSGRGGDPPHDLVDESSEESFPASDAPSWAASRISE